MTIPTYRLKRRIYSTGAVLGIIYDKEDKIICRTLENPWLRNTPFISCVPEGTYICKSFSGAKYQDIWELQDVEGRAWVLIHNGNIERHTDGCILVGESWGYLANELAVLNSRRTLDKLRNIWPEEFHLEIIKADHERDL